MSQIFVFFVGCPTPCVGDRVTYNSKTVMIKNHVKFNCSSNNGEALRSQVETSASLNVSFNNVGRV